MSLDYDCVRQTVNWGNVENSDKFDNSKFSPKSFIKKIWMNSPKMATLMTNIKSLDEKDDNDTGKLYKHFIYTDLKKQRGVKLLVSAFIAAGYNFCIKKEGTTKMSLEYQDDNESNFTVLSSTSLWGIPMSPKLIKQILKDFNERPGNIYGEKCRFIILDSGFKEGIDLFDVKYCHIFEDQESEADLIQAIGRGTRSCGQKGLPFNKESGWKLQTFIYTSSLETTVSEKKQSKEVGSGSWFSALWGNKKTPKVQITDVNDIILQKNPKRSKNNNTIYDIDAILIDNAIDKQLTKKLHETKEEQKNTKGVKDKKSKEISKGDRVKGILTKIAKGVAVVAAIGGLTVAGMLAYKKLSDTKMKNKNSKRIA